MAANFSKTFQVAGTLTVSQGAEQGNSTWASSQFLNLLNGANFYLRGNRLMEFSNGGVSQSGEGVGTIDLRLGATLKLTGGASRLDGNVRVGDGVTAGIVELGGLSGGVFNDAGSILVTTTGTFKMTQTGDSGQFAKGSLWSLGNSNATFTNQGTFVRDGMTSGPYDPEVEFVFINTGTLRVTTGSNIRFTKQDANNYVLINQSGGRVELHDQAHVRAITTGRFKQEGGTFETHNEGSAYSRVWFEVKSDFFGGNLNIGVDGTLGAIEFGNNDVKFANSVVVYMDVDGSAPIGFLSAGDQINVGGASTITIDNTQTNKPSLVITTLFAQPPAGWYWDLFTAPNLIGTFDPNSITFLGQFSPPNGYTVTYPFGPPRTLRITA